MAHWLAYLHLELQMAGSNAHSIPGLVQTPMEHLMALQKAEKMLCLETAPLWVYIHLGFVGMDPSRA
jgi:hypothetical protein